MSDHNPNNHNHVFAIRGFTISGSIFPNLENAYFLACSPPRPRRTGSANARVTPQHGKNAIDVRAMGDDDGTNVVPNHHHGHRAGGGSPPVWYQGGTVRAGSEVTPRA